MSISHHATYLPYRWRLLGSAATCACLLVCFATIVRPDVRLWCGIVTHGPVTTPRLALTFDDGPHPLWTPLLMDTLHRHQARGTFFLVGREAQRYPELVSALIRADHGIGNHSFSHPAPNLTGLPPTGQEREVSGGHDALQQLTRQRVPLFRPPGGGVNTNLLGILRQRGDTLAWWSHNIGDAGPIAPRLLETRLQQARRPGAIFLLHQREHTVQALESFLATTTGDGYTYTVYPGLTEVEERRNAQARP